MKLRVSVQPITAERRIVQFSHAGLVLSLALGAGSYSDGRDGGEKNSTMEVALLPEDGGKLWLLPNGDTVCGWVPVDKLAALLIMLRLNEPAEKRVHLIGELVCEREENDDARTE